LPIKNANNLKINFNFMLANSPNPLFTSISRNHKHGGNLMTIVNFQPMGQANHQGAKLQSA
jgi:hypothetical protein